MQHLRRLEARRASRWEEGLFVAEGPKLLSEALAAGAEVQTVFFEGPSASPGPSALVERAAASGAEVIEVGPGVLARVADAVTPQGVVSVVAMSHVPLCDLDRQGLVVVCAGVADPGNAGTIVRSAAASGAAGVVFCAGGVDVYNPKCVRATAGALWSVPVVASPEATVSPASPASSASSASSVREVLAQLGSSGFTRLAAVARGGTDHDRVDWTRPVALLVGSEAHGLPAEALGGADGGVTVPMQPSSESLNVAMAATVICFEAARQRRLRSTSMGAA